MSIREFYEQFWTALGNLNAPLAEGVEPWGHTNSDSYRGTRIAGTRIYALCNFKERYGDVSTGRQRRDVCVSYYTDHRNDGAWHQLLARLHAEPPPVADATMVIDAQPGQREAAQVLFVKERIAWADADARIPNLAGPRRRQSQWTTCGGWSPPRPPGWRSSRW